MKEEYIWFSNLELENKSKFELIEKVGSVYDLYKSSLDDLVYLNIKDNIINKILDKSLREKTFYDLEYMEKNGIDIISFSDNEYPKNFKLLIDKPICFYIKGNKKILDDEAVGIVGSRIALTESLEIARLSANYFSNKGINVISGLAKGIDKFAHLGALDSKGKGKTIGVLACGLDKKSFYPYENLKVYERIINEEGCVISEYPIGRKPKPYYFPYRNRLISGLSNKIFVIQASTLKSGSMITVDYALEQGKDIYVYKSRNMQNPYFAGNKLLIEEGAKIFKI